MGVPALTTEEKKSAGGRRSIVKILFDRETWKRRARGDHVRVEGGNLQSRKLQNRNNPTNCVLVHVLPRCPRGKGLHRDCVLSRGLKSGCQRDYQGKQNKDSKRPAPQSCSNFPYRIHSKPNAIVQHPNLRMRGCYSPLLTLVSLKCANTASIVSSRT